VVFGGFATAVPSVIVTALFEVEIVTFGEFAACVAGLRLKPNLRARIESTPIATVPDVLRPGPVPGLKGLEVDFSTST
jgi:hypothetical protein